MDSTIYSEIRILIDILVGNILGNHLIGDIPRTAAEVSSCPQVPSPELFLQMRILRQQMVCCLPFQPLQQAADRHLRWVPCVTSYGRWRQVLLDYVHTAPKKCTQDGGRESRRSTRDAAYGVPPSFAHARPQR